MARCSAPDRLPCGGVSNGVNAVVPISRLADLPPAHHLRPGRPEVRILPVAPRAAPCGVLLFLFCMDFMEQQKKGFEQSMPHALRPAGQQRPGGAFLGRGMANPFGCAKKRIAMYFCNAFFYSDSRIILVAYHLPYRCTDLLPAFHFSADSQ